MRGRTRETGETGELLVLAELYRRDVLGGQAARGARGIDLLTSTGHTLQVKAKRGRGRWVLGQEGRRPAADLVVLVSVGKQHGDDEFFVVPTSVLYDWAEDRHQALWATKGDSVSGERHLVQIRDSDADVREFLNPYRDAWEFITDAREAQDGRTGRAGSPALRRSTAIRRTAGGPRLAVNQGVRIRNVVRRSRCCGGQGHFMTGPS